MKKKSKVKTSAPTSDQTKSGQPDQFWHLAQRLKLWVNLELGINRESLGLEAARRNRVLLALAILSLLISISGYHFSGRMGLVLGFFIAVGLNVMVAFYDEWRLMSLFPATELEGRDPWGALKTVQELSRSLKVPLPRVYQVRSSTPFIFSAGLFPSRLKIFISSSLVTSLSEAELKAMFTHELLKAKTGLTATTTAAVALADVFVLAASWIDALLTWRFILSFLQKQSSRPPASRHLTRVYFGPLTWMIFPLVAAFLRLVISRKTFLMIDRLTAVDYGHSEAFLSAMVKLDSYGKNRPLNVNLVEAALFSVDPLASYSWSNWASVHPSLESRAMALTGHFPL